ncbi:MAG TPA: hypothetical protein VFY76_01355 [Nocardioides sp.]|jgi:hypothetical protein|nr:hypothetical protein [Nocardioides sp.]
MDIEIEQGIDRPTVRRRHNGYWAGDFSRTAPMTPGQLRWVTEQCRPRWPGSP